MIGLTSPYLWYTTRATGLVTLILFTGVVVLGSLVANRVGGATVGRFELSELHRSLSIVAVIFLVLHIATTIVDSFVATGPISVLVPLTSSYKRVPVGLGAVAFDLILAVWISSLAKTRLKNETWRFIHWFSWLGWAIAIVHAFLTGTDARTGIGLILVALCTLAGALAGLWRFYARPARAAGRTALSPLAPAAEMPRRETALRSAETPRREAPLRPAEAPRREPPPRLGESDEWPPTPAAFPHRPQDAPRRGRR